MNKKFTSSININEYQVLTDTGFEDIKKLHTTVKYKIWILKTKSHLLKCADNHIVFDDNYKEIYIKNLKIGNTIITANGPEKVLDVYNTDNSEEMYDLELNSNGNKRYYTNNILSHNTSTAFAIVGQFNLPYLYINASDETSVDIIRNKITNFCSTADIMEGKSRKKIVILDECLHQDEEIRIGTIDNYKSVKLKHLAKNKIYDCVSMNIKTHELENDTCEIISERNAEIYEVELENGKKIRVTDNHPFMIMDDKNNIIEKSILTGLNENDGVITF